MKNQKLLPYIKSPINSGKIYTYLNRENDNKYKHNYVYLLVEKETNKMYPGVRSTNKNPLDDLGISYFTSSKYINFKNYPELWEYIIIADHSRRSDAICLEAALHKQHNVKNNDMFFNKSNQNISGYDTTGISPTNKGVPKTAAQKQHLSKMLSGCNNPNYNKTTSQQTKEKISNSLKNNNYKDSEKTTKLKRASALTREPHLECISLFDDNDKLICKSNGKIKNMIRDYGLNSAVIMRYYRKFKQSNISEKISFARPVRAINNGNAKYIGWYFKYTNSKLGA